MSKDNFDTRNAPTEWTEKLADVNVTILNDRELAWADWVFINGMA